MTTLVLCIDRDNDFGEKIGAASPIIGRENNLRAATSMGIADPEESDTNALFGAINIYDQLVREGTKAEIVTICGDRRVGIASDAAITRALDEVIAKVGAKACVFVTDGAEDEFILPLVTSRLRVEAVRRIIVKQNADIEGTFYVIKKAFEDDKIRRQFVIPFALAFVVYGAFALAGQADKGIGAITFTIGTYFILKSLHAFTTVRETSLRAVSGILSGELVVYTTVIAALVVANGVLSTVAGTSSYWADPFVYTVRAAAQLLWWAVLAVLIYVFGRMIDALLHERDVAAYWVLPFSIIASGLIGSALLSPMARAVSGDSLGLSTVEFGQIVLGLLIALAGAGSNVYVKGVVRSAPVKRAADAG